MAVGSMGTLADIVSGGDRWEGRTGPQIACLFISHGMLDQLGDETPVSVEAYAGIGRFGFSFSMN